MSRYARLIESFVQKRNIEFMTSQTEHHESRGTGVAVPANVSVPSIDPTRAPRLSPLVARIRGKLIHELSSGRHVVAEPIPTVREWARKFRVSPSSVQGAFDALKREGIVESREGSYTFLRRIPSSAEVAGSRPEKKASKTRISMWLQERPTLRWVRRSIARHRFQNKHQAEHPDIEIEERVFDVPPSEIELRLISQLMQNPVPTLGQLRRTWIPFLGDPESLAPIAVPEGSETYLDRLHPRWLRACTFGGRLRVLPLGVSCSFLFYNKPIFQKAGLDPEQPPRDWPEFALAIQKIMSVTGGKPAFHFTNNTSLVWWLTQLVYQTMPLENVDASAGVSSLPPVDWMSRSAGEALRFFVELQFKQRALRAHDDDLRSLTSQSVRGEIPMMMGDSWLASLLLQLGMADRFGIAPLPSGPNGRCVSMLNSGGWVLNARASQEEQQAALRYILARESWVHEGTGGAEMKRLGIFPLLFSILKEPSTDQFLAGPLPRQWAGNLDQLIAGGLWEPADSDWKKETLASGISQWMGSEGTRDAEAMQHGLALCESNDDREMFGSTV